MDEVRLNLEGDDGQITAENLHGALGDLLDLLREAATAVETEVEPWRVQELVAASAHIGIASTEASDVLQVVRQGLDDLRQVAAIPERWTRQMVRRVMLLGERVGKGGATGVSLRFGSAAAEPRELTPVVVDHARRALGSATATQGSLRGTVKRWNEQGKHEIGISRDSGRPVPATYPESLSERILREALGHEIEAWGVIHRNEVGQITRMVIEDFLSREPIPVVPIASMVGIYDADGAPSLEDWLERRAND